MKTTLHLFFFLFSLPAVLFAELTDPGTYSATGQKPGIPAPVGYYVPTYGATVALAAPVGAYVPTTGASAPTPAEPGTFVSVSGASVPTPAAPGSYVPTYGASTAQLAPMGHFVDISGATNATPAPPGYYVSTEGATSALAAPVGTYIPTEGATRALPVSPGYYVDGNPATMQTISPVGHFVVMLGATAPTPAPPGYYVATKGATSARVAPVGTYVPTKGASAPTPAEPGTFVSVSGASVPTPAAPGSYVSTYGASAMLMCPQGTTSYVASAGCRIIDSKVPKNPPRAVGPTFAWQDELAGTFIDENSPITFTVTIQNTSSDLSAETPLTALTLLSSFFAGDDASYFSIEDALPVTLSEGESVALNITYVGPTNRTASSHLYLLTDENASVGRKGEVQSLELQDVDDTDGDGLSDPAEELLGTSTEKPDTDDDGFGDYLETLYAFLDPLVDNSDLRTFAQDQRELLDLYSSADMMYGQVGELILQPQPEGGYRLQWNLESTTNLVSGSWTTISTNQITVNPSGQDRGFFRIQVQQAVD
jgi:hypothetical protein